MLVVTNDQAERWQEQCDDGFDTCSWAIFGWTTQDWISIQQYLNRVARYVADLRGVIEFYERVVDRLTAPPPEVAAEPAD